MELKLTEVGVQHEPILLRIPTCRYIKYARVSAFVLGQSPSFCREAEAAACLLWWWYIAGRCTGHATKLFIMIFLFSVVFGTTIDRSNGLLWSGCRGPKKEQNYWFELDVKHSSSSSGVSDKAIFFFVSFCVLAYLRWWGNDCQLLVLRCSSCSMGEAYRHNSRSSYILL